MSLLAEDIPKSDGKYFKLRIDGKLFVAIVDLRISAAGLANARQVAFYVGHKNGNAALAKALGYALERDGLSRSGRSRDDTMAVGHLREQGEFALVVFGYEYWF